MDKARLEQFGALKREIELLEEQILDMEADVKSGVTFDTVKGSMTEFPFTYHTITLCGLGDTEQTRELRQALFSIKARRRSAQKRAVRAVCEIEEFIYSIEDSLTRQIFTLRCVSGCPWESIAAKTNNTADSVKKIYYRYLSKNGIE